MKVKELIAILQRMKPDAELYVMDSDGEDQLLAVVEPWGSQGVLEEATMAALYP